jgi:uncharacterized phosphosugar-binding protein
VTEPIDSYLAAVHEGIDRIAGDRAAITTIAERLAACIAAGGIVHVFGSGHSAMLAQEVFHRAGGLVPFNAMLDINLTIFGTGHATKLERLEGYAPAVLSNHDVRPGDVVLVISTSGVNPVPIEVAEHARAAGALVVALTSAEAYGEADSRHSSGRTLADVADLVIDSRVPRGDAVVGVGGAAVGATSTVLGAFALNLLAVETARLLAAAGHPVPAFASQNLPGGDAHNAALVARYRDRLPLLKP